MSKSLTSLTGLACAAALTLGGVALGGSASADTITVADPQQKHSQGPALDLLQAKFGFGADTVVYRLRIEELSKKRTQVFARLYLANSDLTLVSRFNAKGEQETFGRLLNYRTEQSRRFAKGVRAEWDFANDVVTITLTRKVVGERGRFAAYTVAKGQQHGPVRGDYIFAKVDRG